MVEKDNIYFRKKKLMKKTKKEIIDFFMGENGYLKRSKAKLVISNTQRLYQIKHFRRRLGRIRGSIDYLLEHPFSMDNSCKTRPREKEGMHPSRSLYGKKRKLNIK